MVRPAVRRCGAVLTAVVACLAGVARADDVATWLDVASESPIDHAVMVRGPFDDAHRKVQLAGPVGVVAAGSDGFRAVYAIVDPGAEPPRSVQVGANSTPLRLGPPAFLLVPARRLREGATATDAPAGVHEARPIIDPPDAVDGAAAGRPTLLCLPVDYRHHFERMPVTDAGRGLLVRGARPGERTDAPIDVADDFGLHRLSVRGTCRDAAWMPVKAQSAR